MGRKFDYQYLVVGSGAAGSAAALLAAELGARTAIIEADRWGGTTLNYRDVPYGAALGFARRYSEAVSGARFGMSSTSLKFNYPTVLNWQAAAVRRAGGGNRKIFENAGIDCYHGFAQFIGPHEVVVDGQQLSSEMFLLATGTDLTVSGIAGVEAVNCWSPDTILRIAKLPKELLIVGGGSTGCEIAQYFAALGTKVVIVEAADRLLPKEDPEVSDVIAKHLHRQYKVEILTNSRVIALEQTEDAKKVVFVRDGQEKSTSTDTIVLAITPEPATDLGLENAGVKFDFHGVDVNNTLRTTNPNIWAAGDVVGGESSTEKAVYEAKLATMNALQNAGMTIDYTGFVRMTDTWPQVAKVGLNEIECAQIGQKQQSVVVPIEMVSAANINDFRDGFVKLTTNQKDQIIGATVVTPNAELVIQEIVLAIRSGVKAGNLAVVPHIATSWGEAIRVAARELS